VSSYSRQAHWRLLLFCCGVRADFKVIENLFHSKSNQNVIKAAEKSLDVQNLPSASTMSTEGVMHDFRFTVHACIDGSEGVRDNPQSIMTFLNDCRHRSCTEK
jgi:hypothetical protein